MNIVTNGLLYLDDSKAVTVGVYAKQKYLVRKKMRGQSEAALQTSIDAAKTLISAEVKKLLYQNILNSLNDQNY